MTILQSGSHRLYKTLKRALGFSLESSSTCQQYSISHAHYNDLVTDHYGITVCMQISLIQLTSDKILTSGIS